MMNWERTNLDGTDPGSAFCCFEECVCFGRFLGVHVRWYVSVSIAGSGGRISSVVVAGARWRLLMAVVMVGAGTLSTF